MLLWRCGGVAAVLAGWVAVGWCWAGRWLAASRLQTPDRHPCAPLVAPRMAAQMSDAERTALLRRTDVTVSTSILGHTAIFVGQRGLDATRERRDGPAMITEIDTPLGALGSRTVETPDRPGS